MSRVALYARVSTRDKDQNPETQLRILRQWAADQKLEYAEFADYASGKNLNRPQWAAMTQGIQRGSFKTVVVLRLDRAFRSVLDMSLTLVDWEARKVRFVSVTQPIDTSTAMGRMFLQLLVVIAEFERALIAERVLEGLDRAKAEGKTLGRPSLLKFRYCNGCGKPSAPRHFRQSGHTVGDVVLDRLLALVPLYRARQISQSELSRRLAIPRSSVIRLLACVPESSADGENATGPSGMVTPGVALGVTLLNGIAPSSTLGPLSEKGGGPDALSAVRETPLS